MPIPPFDHQDVLPPFLGNNPAIRGEMSPYRVSALDVVDALATNPNRRDILSKWLQHRAALRAAGLGNGFQWLDGSFVENKDPNDLDVVHFTNRPAGATLEEWLALITRHRAILTDRHNLKNVFRLDFFIVELEGTPEALVDNTRYWFGLFSHRRVDLIWKGMLQVDMSSNETDQIALGRINEIAREAERDV